MTNKSLTILVVFLLVLTLATLGLQYLLLTRIGEDVNVTKGQEPTGVFQAVRSVGNTCVICGAETEELSKEIDKLKSRVSYLSGELARLKNPPSE